mgnify:CR=1 FL=1
MSVELEITDVSQNNLAMSSKTVAPETIINIKKGKTEQDETNKTGQDETDETGQDKTEQDKTQQSKSKQHPAEPNRRLYFLRRFSILHPTKNNHLNQVLSYSLS